MNTVRTQPCQVIAKVAGTGDATLRLQARVSVGPRGLAVVAPPHPLFGGSNDNPVVLHIVQAFSNAKRGALAFNWRGVEGSEGCATDDLEQAVLDYGAAIDHAATLAPSALWCAGYSFGAGSALLASRDDTRVTGLVLVAPPVGMLRAEDLTAFHGRLIVVVGDDDEYAPLAELQAVLATRADATLEVIRGADHFFHFGGLPEIEAKLAPHLLM